jgi:uncharacterized protein YndB with AHSA1/START domain
MNTAAVTVTTPSDREVVVTRSFHAPRQLVWDAHTKPELVRRWLLGPPGWTMPTCEIDLRVGGRYRYVLAGPEGELMGWGGVYREIVPPERLVSAELFDEDWTGGETVNTMVLSDRGDQTDLTLTVVYASKDARDGALATGMTVGMEAGYRALDSALASMMAQGG